MPTQIAMLSECFCLCHCVSISLSLSLSLLPSSITLCLSASIASFFPYFLSLLHISRSHSIHATFCARAGPNYEVWITRSCEDVTAQVLPVVQSEADPLKRANAVRDCTQSIAAKAEAAEKEKDPNSGVRCDVQEMFPNESYVLLYGSSSVCSQTYLQHTPSGLMLTLVWPLDQHPGTPPGCEDCLRASPSARQFWRRRG